VAFAALRHVARSRTNINVAMPALTQTLEA
jgi:hypothetical protein